MCHDNATYQRVMSNMQRDKPEIFAAISSNPPAFMNMVKETMANPAAMARARASARPLAQNEVGVSPKEFVVI